MSSSERTRQTAACNTSSQQSIDPPLESEEIMSVRKKETKKERHIKEM